MGWLTPDSIPAATRCRTLFIPDDELIIAAVNGALLDLIYSYNWQQFGLITPAAMADSMQAMYDAFSISECATMIETDIFWHLLPNNTGGGSITASTETVAPFNAEAFDNAGNVTLSGNAFTIVNAGLYKVEGWHMVRGDVAFRAKGKFRSNLIGDILQCSAMNSPANNNVKVEFVTMLQFTVGDVADFRVVSSDTLATNGLGAPANLLVNSEYYGQMIFTKLD